MSDQKKRDPQYEEDGMVLLLAGTRAKGEKAHMIIACNDYLRMGKDRTLKSLADHYKNQMRRFKAGSIDYQPPTTNYRTLQSWSRKYDWQTRLRLFLAELEQAKEERLRSITDLFLAKPQERVQELGFMFSILKKPITRYHDQQVALENQESRGEETEDGTFTFVNTDGHMVKRKLMGMPMAEIREARNILNDIAMEMGDRRGYVPKDEGDIIMVTGDDIRHAVKGMDVYEETLKQSWDVSNPEFIGDLPDLIIPDRLEGDG